LKVRRLEDWKIRRLEDWKIGRSEDWKIGRLEDWRIGRSEDWKIFFILQISQINADDNHLINQRKSAKSAGEYF
jgi:hypothetical protein